MTTLLREFSNPLLIGVQRQRQRTVNWPHTVAEIIPGINYIPISWLKSNEPYQRLLNSNKINTMMEEFDEDLLGRIIVVRYPDGSIARCDGHHRNEVCRLKFGEDYRMECMVKDVANVREASKLA